MWCIAFGHTRTLSVHIPDSLTDKPDLIKQGITSYILAPRFPPAILGGYLGFSTVKLLGTSPLAFFIHSEGLVLWCLL